ncbi:hypothetical protein GH714_002338 [Hevea brasiliensis]|uniref:S-locus glycoprotein domain-containing protein n=1 Tax=Hevea brasiliensis TaxID=3981 RepID=A0A6A6LGM5_HEVBR|nr:hypothetical protein GH714_002338 [Hevea brasiliensis]
MELMDSGYTTPQVYWSWQMKAGKPIIGLMAKCTLHLCFQFRNFYDHRLLLWQFIFSDNSDPHAMWALTLGSDGAIGFYNFEKGKSVILEATKIPQNPCSVPEPCDRYYVCYFDNRCQCPPQLNTHFGCKPPVASTCNGSKNSAELFYVGSLTRSREGSSGYISYMKVSVGERNSASSRNVGKEALLIAIIVIATVVAIACLLYVGIWYRRRWKKYLEFQQQNQDGDDFWDSLPGMPARYIFSDLCKATKNFSMLEEGRLREIIDPKLDINENDVRVVTAIKVALWCIQEEMQLRPPMTKVVQMLEGLCDVPDPPISSQSASRSMSSVIKWNGKECSSSGFVDDTSDAFLSDTGLSGPR